MTTSRRDVFSPPESVTIPGAIVLEALALLDAYAELMADFRLDGEPNPFYEIEDPIWMTFMRVLGYDKTEVDLHDVPVWDVMKGRSAALQDQIRSHFDGPALGAIATTKIARDVSEVKARLEYARV